MLNNNANQALYKSCSISLPGKIWPPSASWLYSTIGDVVHIEEP